MLDAFKPRYFEEAVALLLGLLPGLALVLFMVCAAFAHDNSQWAQNDPAKRDFFNGLHSPHGGPCCSFADGWQIDDADWETEGDHYTVRIEGVWYKVPEEALVTDRNKYGIAVVWPVKMKDGSISIRCFMPGTEG